MNDVERYSSKEIEDLIIEQLETVNTIKREIEESLPKCYEVWFFNITELKEE